MAYPRQLARHGSRELEHWYEGRCVVCDCALRSGQTWFCSDDCRGVLRVPTESLRKYFWRENARPDDGDE